MSGESWQILGNIVNTAGVTGFAITGATTVLAGYQTYVSPYASLAESERKLDKVQSRLQELTPQQREEIDARSRASGSKGLTVLEKELINLRYKFYRLSMGCDEMSFMERHIPFSQLRERVRQLVNHSRALFKDTLATTVPHADDMGFDFENPRLVMDRSSSSESPESSITFPTPSIDAISMSRIV